MHLELTYQNCNDFLLCRVCSYWLCFFQVKRTDTFNGLWPMFGPFPHFTVSTTNWYLPRASPEKAMAPHSSTLAWKIPWTEEPGTLQSMGSLRVGHNWATPFSLFTFMHWRRKWQPTPVFLPGESQGWGSLVGCRLWDLTELDTTEAT